MKCPDCGHEPIPQRIHFCPNCKTRLPTSPVIDFSSYIADRTRDFTGREWVFAEIDCWLADPEARPSSSLPASQGSARPLLPLG